MAEFPLNGAATQDHQTDAINDLKELVDTPHDHDAEYAALVHDHDDLYYTEGEVDAALAGKSDTAHTHDDRYYTETEVDTALAGKSDTSHTHNAHGALVTKSANEATATGTEEELLWDVEEFDTDAIHSTVSNTGRLTVPAGMAGLWQIYASIAYEQNATGVRRVFIDHSVDGRIAGVSGPAGSNNNMTINASVTWNMAVGEQVRVAAFQNSGGALNVLANDADLQTYFGMNYLGPI